jgi:hypothetical protein
MSEDKIEQIRIDVAKKLKTWDRPIWGYEAPKIERNEGEEWTDDAGKRWIRKNGINQSISKLEKAKTPWFCPKCSKSMSHRFDMMFYRRKGQCFDCTISEDTQRMKNGAWDEYEKKVLRSNEKGFLKDKIAEYKDYVRTFKVPQIHFENGGWQEIAKIEQFKEMFATIKKDIELCEARIKEIETEEQREQNDDSIKSS